MLGVAFTLFRNARKTRLGLAISLMAVVLVLGFKLSATTVILCGIVCGILWHLLMRYRPDNGDTIQ